MIQELKKRAPVVVRKAIVSVDILKDSAEDVLHVVTGCFASATGHLPELGLRTAEAYVVLRAWNQHLVLHANAQSQRGTADRLFAVQIFLLMCTAVCAALGSEFQVKGYDPGPVTDRALHYALIFIPILSAIIATIIQRKRAVWRPLLYSFCGFGTGMWPVLGQSPA